MEKDFDLIIIGAGPGGYAAAIRAAKAGLHTAVVENRRVGGTCLNRGCIPAKAMVHASSLYREAKDGEQFGVMAADASYDYGKILSYKSETVDTLVGGIEQLLKGNGVETLTGTGTLQMPREGLQVVSVKGAEHPQDGVGNTHDGMGNAQDGVEHANLCGECSEYTAEHVILAGGSQPAKLPVPGADLAKVLNSDELFALEHAPKSLLIIGGGVIGVEFANIFSNLGIGVTIIEALPRILDNFDKEISRNLQMILKKRGVEIHTAAMVQGFEEAEDGSILCRYSEKDKDQEATAEYVLVAAGRRPVMEDLLGQGVSLEMNGKFIAVNDKFETSLPGVYAIGDLTGGMQLAHAATAQGNRVIENLCAEAPSQDLAAIPGGVYTDPEIASVGLTEAQAKDQGIEFKTGKFIMSANGKSVITKEERGFIKVVADAATDEILGAQMMCARATDMIGEFTTAIVNHMTVADLIRSVRAHPTYNEAITEALEDVNGDSLHTLPRRRR